MKWFALGDYGEYLVLRKRNIEKKAFFDAIDCLETDSFSVQNVLYEVLCKSGSSTHEMYEEYCKTYDGEYIDEAAFLSEYFFRMNIYREAIKEFLESKKKDEECFYVDASVVDGYSFRGLLDYDDEDSKRFIDRFLEATETL